MDALVEGRVNDRMKSLPSLLLNGTVRMSIEPFVLGVYRAYRACSETRIMSSSGTIALQRE